MSTPPFVHETTQTIGATSAHSLDGAVTGRRAFSEAFNDLDTVEYWVVSGDTPPQYESVVGTYDATNNDLSRDTIKQSSNGGLAVDWGSGVKDIYAYPSEDADFLPLAGGTMTGKIVLDGDPTANLHPVTKQWAESNLVVTDGTSVIQPATGTLQLVLLSSGAAGSEARLVLGDSTSGPLVRLRWRSDQDDLRLTFNDGVDEEGVFNVTQNALTFEAGVAVTLAQDPAAALEAATKQYVDDAVAGSGAGNLEYASGDETIWGGASVPAGFSIVTLGNDRIPLPVDTAAETKSNAGSWTISGISVNNHTLTVSQMPGHTHSQSAHTHNVTVKYNTTTGDLPAGAADSLVTNINSAGANSETFTTTSAGGGNTGSTGGGSGHSHGVSHNGGWRPLHRTCVWISKT